MSDEKLYRIKTKDGAHVNEKVKDDGSRAAIQFDEENGLQGPVDLAPEEVDQILNNMKFAALYIAAGIRELSNTFVTDDGTNPEKALDMQDTLKKLSSGEVMKTIEFMLEDKNRDKLDQATIRLFEAFKNKDFIVEGEAVPISQYLSVTAEEQAQ